MTKSKIQNKSKFQISKIKILVLIFVIGILNLFCALNFEICHSYSQASEQLINLSKKIITASAGEDLYASFNGLEDLYLTENKYSEFIEFLKSLSQKKKELGPLTNYYIAKTRYLQLKYLEERQSWDEYFSQGNAYRDELTNSAKSAIDATAKTSAINIYARLILWQFHKDRQVVYEEDELPDLVADCLEYSKTASYLEPIKEVADKLAMYQEKGRSRELYKVYAEKLVANAKLDELKDTALNFYKEGNPELAESVYDVYVNRINEVKKKEKILASLIDIANLFVYKDTGASDPLYAEKIFSKIEEIGGKESFNQELMYLRAFNLEKAKEYSRAKDVYLDLAGNHGPHWDEALFKAGVIYTYILRDLTNGLVIFEKLAKSENLSPQVISSIYQLGLFSFWRQDSLKAKEYFNLLLEKAGADFKEIPDLARQRIKEIDEEKPIEYNLKTFLDASLLEEYRMLETTKIDLRSYPYKAKINENVSITSNTYTPASGCMQVELEYLWSGDLGDKIPASSEAEFNTAYTDKGTKVINLIAISPSGIIDRSLDLVDVN